MAANIYRALRVEAHEIRLAILRRCTNVDATPVCDLVHTSLYQAAAYEALSYVWGAPPKDPKHILLNSQRYPVTDNLYDALTHLQQPTHDRVLWVDAICIDQQNLDERAQQVRLMQDIFTHCSVDLFWLGKREIEPYMQFLRRLSEDPKINKRLAERRTRSVLSNLFEIPRIWSRVWVMQEIACAPRVQLVAGREILEWERVESLLTKYRNAPIPDSYHESFDHGMRMPDLKTVLEPAQTCLNQRRAIKKMREGQQTTFLDILSRLRYTHSTDPRDKIYGLMGLVSEPHNIQVDYRKTVQQVFTEVAKHLLNSSQDLDLLCQSRWKYFGAGRMADLPSWVPDFNAPARNSLLFAQRSIYKAGLDTAKPSYKILPGDMLHLNCTWLGSVALRRINEKLMQRLLLSHSISSQISGAKRNEARDGLGHRPTDEFLTMYHATGEPLYQAFWRTFVADCKAYPIIRLTQEEIAAQNHALWREIERGYKFRYAPSFTELDKNEMRDRMQTLWSIAETDSEFFAMVPHATQVNDKIAVVPGCKTPLVLRRVDGYFEGDGKEVSLPKYVLLGPAYVHGFMDGQAVRWAESERLENEDVVVV